MPLIRIDLEDSIPVEVRRGISRGLHLAVVDALNEVPQEDDFQIVTVHSPGELVFHPTYAGLGNPVKRDGVIYVQILIDGEHDEAVKRKLYRNIGRELGAVGVRRDNIFVALTINGPNDWWAGSSEND